MTRFRNFQHYVLLFTSNSFGPHDPAHVPKYSHYLSADNIYGLGNTRWCHSLLTHHLVALFPSTGICISRLTYLIPHVFFLSYYKLNINIDCNTTVHSSKSGILLMQYCQERWCGLLGLAVEHHLPNVHTYKQNLQTRKHNYHIYRNIWPW